MLLINREKGAKWKKEEHFRGPCDIGFYSFISLTNVQLQIFKLTCAWRGPKLSDRWLLTLRRGWIYVVLFLLALRRSGTSKETPTHLHKEEAWHYVGAGLLQACVIRKAACHPPLCWLLTSDHLWVQKSRRLIQECWQAEQLLWHH